MAMTDDTIVLICDLRKHLHQRNSEEESTRESIRKAHKCLIAPAWLDLGRKDSRDEANQKDHKDEYNLQSFGSTPFLQFLWRWLGAYLLHIQGYWVKLIYHVNNI